MQVRCTYFYQDKRPLPTFAYLGQGKGCLEHASTALLQLLQHISMKWCGWIHRLEQKRTCDVWKTHERRLTSIIRTNTNTTDRIRRGMRRYMRCQLCFSAHLYCYLVYRMEENTSEMHPHAQQTASTIVRNDVWSFCGNREGWRVCYIPMHNRRAIKVFFILFYFLRPAVYNFLGFHTANKFSIRAAIDQRMKKPKSRLSWEKWNKVQASCNLYSVTWWMTQHECCLTSIRARANTNTTDQHS